MTNVVEDKCDTHREVSIIMKRNRRLDLRFSLYPRPIGSLKLLSHCPKLAVKNEGAPKGSPCNHERQCGYCPICRLGFFVWSIPVVAQPIQDDNHDLGPRWRAFGAVSLTFWCVGELIVWRSIHIMDELEISNNVTQQFGIVDVTKRFHQQPRSSPFMRYAPSSERPARHRNSSATRAWERL